jgi:hydroxymethylglutaryl-CoA lyase
VNTQVAFREVLPRDGLQDMELVPTRAKVALITRLCAAGLRWIEVSSMVSPRWVPQFSDAEIVVDEARRIDGLRVSVFVPNLRGLERAQRAGAHEVSLAVATTDTLSRANFGMSSVQAMSEVTRVVAAALENGLDASVTIGAAFACPFEGAVAPSRVLDLARTLAELGVTSIFIADTIGAARPPQIAAVVADVVEVVGAIPVGIHLHVTGDNADGVLEGVRAGAVFVDVSTAGIGGCPFVPDPPGNVSATAAARLLGENGIGYGQQLSALQQAETDVCQILKEVPAHASAQAH